MGERVNIEGLFSQLKIFDKVNYYNCCLVLRTTLPIKDYISPEVLDLFEYSLEYHTYWRLYLTKKKNESEVKWVANLGKLFNDIKQNIEEKQLPTFDDKIKEKNKEEVIEIWP